MVNYDPKEIKSVACPTCHALSGQPCKSKSGKSQAGFHRARHQVYNLKIVSQKKL